MDRQSFRKWHYCVYLAVAVAEVVLVFAAATATAADGCCEAAAVEAVEAVAVGDSAAGSTLHSELLLGLCLLLGWL